MSSFIRLLGELYNFYSISFKPMYTLPPPVNISPFQIIIQLAIAVNCLSHFSIRCSLFARLTAISTSPAEGTTLDSSESNSAPYPILKTFPKVISYTFPSRALLQITGSWLYAPLYSSMQKIDLQWGTSHKLLITLTSPQYLSMLITGLQNHTSFKLCRIRELDTIWVVFRFVNWHWNQVMT